MILVFGKNGQLASCLAETPPSDLEASYIERSQCDLSVPGAVTACLDTYEPDWIINAAAYTQVDRAEEEPEQAYQINGKAVEEMAAWVAQRKPTSTRLIHISTDFVFDGESTSPYSPDSTTNPLGEYGRSKLAGEKAVLDLATDSSMIIRTAWVYSEHGSNFVKTMLRLMAEREELGVVNDQRGSPTYARGLAEVIWRLVTTGTFAPGVYHWTDAGDITWYDFAAAIQEEATGLGLLETAISVKPIGTADYPTPARRPACSVLDCSKLGDLLHVEPEHWRDTLRAALVRLAENQ